jgi:hypothetical protein
MYKVGILYTGKYYQKNLNMIKYEEAKGNIEVTGVGVPKVYANKLDGWQLKTIPENSLSELRGI